MALIPLGLGAAFNQTKDSRSGNSGEVLGTAAAVNEPDPADKFSYKTTPLVLSLLIALVGYQQYIDKPLFCHFPSEHRNWIDYVDKFCWTEGYYYSSVVTDTTKLGYHHVPDTTQKRVAIYQWLPFILALHAILFFSPHMIWKFLATGSPFEVNDLLTLSLEVRMAPTGSQQRAKATTQMCKSLEKFLKTPPDANSYSREKGVSCREECCKPRTSTPYRVFFGKYRGVFLILSHIFIKILYMANGVGQVIAIQHAFNQTTFFFGVNNIAASFRAEQSEMSRVFPPVNYCRVELSSLNGSVSHVFAQCSIPGNSVNRKIYAFLWFWLLTASLISCLSLFVWTGRILRSNQKKGFIAKSLKQLSDHVTKEERRAASAFIRENFRRDGLFLLDLICKQAGELVTAEIVYRLWVSWRDRLQTAEEGLDKMDPVNGIEMEEVQQETA